MLAVSYGNVYVAQIALGANPNQTLRAFLEAESYPRPVADLGLQPVHRPRHQHDPGHDAPEDRRADAACGRCIATIRGWRTAGEHPFHLDSRKPTIPFAELAEQEARFAMVARSDPENAERLIALAQKDIDDQWHYYEQMAGVEREIRCNGEEVTSCVPT